MSELKYPVGMATFSELIEEGYTYVDKTRFIKPLLSHGKFIFLRAHLIKNEGRQGNGMDPEDINGVKATKSDLVSIGFDDMNPVPLMFQTGYLTIESYDRESQIYTLRLPNREVEIGFLCQGIME